MMTARKGTFDFAGLTGEVYYCPQSLANVVLSPLTADRFEERLVKGFGKRYITFYEGRNGLYHVLAFLHKNFGSQRVFVPDPICWPVILAAKTSGLTIVRYNEKPAGMRKGDVLVTIDSDLTPPPGTFSIQDNAKNPVKPSSRFDFTLYSFAEGKPLSSGGGGLVIVNNENFESFLDLREKLVRPSLETELKRYERYLFWKLKSYRLVRKYGRMLRHAIKGDYVGKGTMDNIDCSMCSFARKLAAVNIDTEDKVYVLGKNKRSEYGSSLDLMRKENAERGVD
ncbi:MAG: hypothetical protein KGI04_04945 [Candidatus Micrarchaeota archaeon]|nr:hypothetical protein [Candidatus Micrarchaeota archaeon]